MPGNLIHVWRTFCDRAIKCKTVAAQLDAAGAGGATMKKVLGAFDLTMLGIGGIIGAGVFVTTGVAARGKEGPDGSLDGAGPAVTVSFALASAVSLLCALCYTEFATAVPVAGGAFVYVSVTFGELAAWLVGANLVLEYTLSSAAVARGWTSYAAEAMQMSPDSLRVSIGIFDLDFVAPTLILALSALLAKGIREGATFNLIVTGINLAVILVILVVGFAKVEPGNYAPFAPNGWPAISAAASIVFFSFIGFDTVASAAEEVRNPARDLPLGILASLAVCTILYIAMSLALTGLVPWGTLDVDAPFGQAFLQRGMPWVDTLVSVGALTGITTSLLVALVGGARVLVTLARERLVPAALAHVHPRHRTPSSSQWFTGLTSAAIALLVDIEVLARMVNIGTLFVFFSVAAAVLARRYCLGGNILGGSGLKVGWRLSLVCMMSLVFSVVASAQSPWWVSLLVALLLFASAATFLMLPVATNPPQFQVPLVPFTPAAAMAGTLWLIGSLGGLAFLRFAIWCAISLVAYLSYGMFQAQEDGQGAFVGLGSVQLSALDDRNDERANGGSEWSPTGQISQRQGVAAVQEEAEDEDVVLNMAPDSADPKISSSSRGR